MKRGRGRPPIGIQRQVKLTLPPEDWKQIEKILENKEADSLSDYFRQLHQNHNVSDKWRSL